MGFRYPHIKGTRKYCREKRRFGGAFGRGDTGTWIMYVKSPGERVGKKKTTTTTEHNKRDVYPRLFLLSVSAIFTVCWWKAKNFLLFFLQSSPFIVSRTVHKLFTTPSEEIDKLHFFHPTQPSRMWN